MKFYEALKALEDGAKIRSVNDPSGQYLIKILDAVLLRSEGKMYDKSSTALGNLILQEWEIYEEPETTYTFMEVVKELREGKKFIRTYWRPDRLNMVLTRTGLVNSFLHPQIMCVEDFEATDWVEVK